MNNELILYIDTSESRKVVVKLGGTGLAKPLKIEKENQTGSQALLPAIVEILKSAGKKFEDLTEVKVNPGPGSYTGLRVGLAIANALGFVLDVPVNGEKGKIALPKYE